MKCLLIKNADVYAPQPLGIVDILIINDKIAKIGQQLAAPQGLDCQILDAQERKVVPGYVDQHVHIIEDVIRSLQPYTGNQPQRADEGWHYNRSRRFGYRRHLQTQRKPAGEGQGPDA